MGCKDGQSASPSDVITHIGPKLIPFLKGVAIYFVAWLPTEYPSLISCLIKCLPIICLIYFVGCQGITLERHHDYQRRIFVGLIFSCIGDALLIWHETHFVTAMIMFGIAHISYIRAFGIQKTQPYRWLKGLPFLAAYIIAMYNFYPGLKGILIPGVFIYVLILGSMGWRAIASVDILKSIWSWTSLAGCIGANVFIISDLIIGVDKFVYPVPMARLIIMSTYYVAQVLLAVSAVNKDNLMVKIKMSEKKVQKDPSLLVE